MAVKKVCATCGSEDVKATGNVYWNVERQIWEVGHVYEDSDAWCNSDDCDGAETEIIEEEIV